MANTDKRIDELSNLSSLTGDELVLLQDPTTLEYGKTTLANVSAKSPVTSVAGKTGAVSLTKDDVGLSNAENTADVNKPISSATQAALNSKEGTINPGNTGQYFRGDKTWQTLDKSAVGLGNVDNTNDLSKPISTATQTALDTKATTTALDAHANSTANPHNVTKAQVGLGNVDNTSDANKPVSTAQQTALDGKQPLDATLTSLAAHNTNGILTQTAADTFAGRTITGTANQVTVTNGDGVSGNPTLSLPQDIHTGASPTFLKINTTHNVSTGGVFVNTGTNKFTDTGVYMYNSNASFGSNAGVAMRAEVNNYTADGTTFSIDQVNRWGGWVKSLFTFNLNGGTSVLGVPTTITGNYSPTTDSTYTLGTSSLYWKETYTDKLFLNSTATLDGSTAGQVNLTGEFNVNGVKSIYIPDQASFGGSMFFGSGGRNLSYNSGDEGRYNNAMGYNALLSNTTGAKNNAMGYEALKSNTTGVDNNAMGYLAMADNTIGNYNSAQGNSALRSNTTGHFNSALGLLSLYSNNGSSNSGLGSYALYANTTGSNNSAVGSHAGRFIADGSTANAITNSSVFIGFGTKALANNQTNQTVIGYNAIGNGSNTVTIGNSSVTGNFFSGNIESTTVSGGVILKSPDGTRYKLTIANGGTVTVSAA